MNGSGSGAAPEYGFFATIWHVLRNTPIATHGKNALTALVMLAGGILLATIMGQPEGSYLVGLYGIWVGFTFRQDTSVYGALMKLDFSLALSRLAWGLGTWIVPLMVIPAVMLIRGLF